SESSSASANGPSPNASTQAQANAAPHAQSNTSSSTSSNASTSAGTSQSAQSTSKLTPGGSKFPTGCGGTNASTNTSAHQTNNSGVQPSSSTKHWTCAPAAGNQTKLYGNGMTAGKGTSDRGGKAAKLYGPGNSQPHKVACPPGRHMRDWHAVKSFNPDGTCS